MDTTRRDHLSVYGYNRPTSRELERLAERGALFLNAFAQQNRTLPSHASMFTGMYPQDHGSLSNDHPLHQSRTTLANLLRAAGFQTAGFVSGYTLKKSTGIAAGFQVYDDEFGGMRRRGDLTVARAEKWLRTRSRDDRFFLFLHLFDAHGPYMLPPDVVPFRAPIRGRMLNDIPSYQRLADEDGTPLDRLNDYVDRYDTLLRYQDALIARLLTSIDMKNTLIVVLADHGESLGERIAPLNHGVTLFDEEIRIPLLVAGPGVSPGKVDAAVETVDLLPTLLAALGLSSRPAKLPGRNLTPLLHNGTTPEEWGDMVFASSVVGPNRYRHLGYELDAKRQVHAARTAEWKLIRYPHATKDYIELYDLQSDPSERKNVAPRHPAVRSRLAVALDRWHHDVRTAIPAAAPKTEDELEKLRSLGYVR